MFANEIVIFFNLIKACCDALSVYPPDSPMLNTQMGNFLKAVDRFRGADGALRLHVSNGVAAYNGETLPPRFLEAGSVKWFVEQCGRRRIGDIHFEDGLTHKDAVAFFQLLRLEETQLPNRDAARRRFAELGGRRLEINPGPEAGSGTAAPRQERRADGGPAAPTPADEPPAGDEPQIKLFLSAEDWQTLSQSIDGMLRQRRLDKLGESLGAMRQDLSSEDRQTREVAYSSYHVAVLRLIVERQNQPLFTVLKAMATDLTQTVDPDLFVIHLETAVKILEYFRASKEMKRFLFGLNLLAEARMWQRGGNARRLDGKLKRLVDPALTAQLLVGEDPELEPAARPLFTQRVEGFLAPLLLTLFESEDRNVRKKLLTVIEPAAEKVQGVLVAELWRAIRAGDPWYVKRNLLTLLQRRPPADLTGAVEVLLKEDHPKLRELLMRTLFRLDDRKAFARAAAILRHSDEARQIKLIAYVVAGGVPDYAPILIEIYQKTESEKLKLLILDAIARLGSAIAIEFLVTILDKPTLFAGKERRRLREAAARGLAASGKPKALAAMTRFARDSDKTVRDIANQALAKI